MLIRKLSILFVCYLALAGGLNAGTADEEAVTATVMDYFEGLRTADKARLEKAFAVAGGHMKNLDSDAQGNTVVKVTPITEAIVGWTEKPRPQLKGKVLSVDVLSENAAVATFDFDGRYLDFFQLVKLEGQWKIINKTYVDR